MKDESEIVKEMRKSENLGKLSSKPEGTSQETFYELDGNAKALENNLEKGKESFEFGKEIDSICCENEELYRRLVENSSEGILIIDFKSKILFANPAVVKMFGFKSIDESIGKNALDFLESKYRKIAIKDQLLVNTGKGGFSDTYEAITADGKKIWIECIGSKIKYKGKTSNVVFIRDTTDRQKIWEKLAKLEERYRILAETSVDGILTIDPLGRLTYVNPSFERMSMREKNDIIMTPFREYLSGESIYLFQQIFIDARKMNKKIENIELEFVQDDGNIIPIEINICPLKKDDEFTGIVCTVHDLTERNNIENELKKSERLKTEFMNIAAHELKSPVTPIKGYLDLIISDTEASEKVKNWASISLRNSERLLRLVNDILDVSRLDSDTMRFDMEKLNTADILNEIAEDMKLAVENKNLEFKIHISDDLPHILGDRCRLLQVLRNIIGNAIKFTDNGYISIEAKREGDYVLISVEDTGTGISNEESKKIFTKFYQAYTGNDRNNEGTGLGLFICREIIEKHNGKIWVESKLR
ncbi:MAG: PAS domain-containing sensor histidine kinase, partial [Thermoplasmatales archaeon]|nr:PAS domain-containing sensor histidine kinase [Thermoplasmatales archaeon]